MCVCVCLTFERNSSNPFTNHPCLMFLNYRSMHKKSLEIGLNDHFIVRTLFLRRSDRNVREVAEEYIRDQHENNYDTK